MRSKKLIALLVILLALGYSFFENTKENSDISPDTMSVTFLDVGQGDCSVIKLPKTNEVIMIDSGEYDCADKIMAFLDDNNIDTIDYLIATHPHSDHIGGMAEIVDNYNIVNVYMPRASNDTKTFESLLTSIKNKGLKVTEAKSGVVMLDGEVKAEFVAPVSTGYEEINDYSAVLKLSYNDISFLFTGDAEKVSENEMIHSGVSLYADVLKVGHHGSNTSSKMNFLQAVKPEYAIISTDGESYGHPHDEVLDRLDGVEIFKTYESGSITVITDGRDIDIKTER